MCMDEAEAERQVLVIIGFDIGDLMRIPADGSRPIERKLAARHRREALIERPGSVRTTEQSPDREHRQELELGKNVHWRTVDGGGAASEHPSMPAIMLSCQAPSKSNEARAHAPELSGFRHGRGNRKADRWQGTTRRRP